MGNHLPCMSPASLHDLQQVVSSNPPLFKDFITILHYEKALLTHLQPPLTAAEVMMESPGLFLCCHSRPSSSTSRICAVPADKYLHTGELYILLPMCKLNARFSSEEIASFAKLIMQKKNSSIDASNVNGASHPRHPRHKIALLPSSGTYDNAQLTQSVHHGIVGHSLRSQSAKLQAPGDSILKLEGASSFSWAAAQPGTMMCRSKAWVPKLETITEARAAV